MACTASAGRCDAVGPRRVSRQEDRSDWLHGTRPSCTCDHPRRRGLTRNGSTRENDLDDSIHVPGDIKRPGTTWQSSTCDGEATA